MAKTYSLTALADRLRPAGNFEALVNVIDAWTHRNSRLVDMRHALDLLDQIDELNERRTRPENPAVAAIHPDGDQQGALFAHAIILYARAGKAGGDSGRKYAFDLSGRFSEEQAKLHSELLKLRDKVVAHYDNERQQTWLRGEALVLMHSAEDWEYGFTFSHTTFQRTLVREFRDLLGWLTPALEEELHRENDTLHEALAEAINADVTFQREILACEFDEDGFYGKGPATQAIKESLKVPGSRFTATVSYPAS